MDSKTNSTRQFWIRSPGLGEIVDAPLPPARAGEALVRALYSGISRGTESLVFRGEVPPSQYLAMRAPFQEGDFPGPVKYGYSSVGVVAEAAEDGGGPPVGTAVFCLHPHQDLYRVPATSLAPLPRDLPPGRAVLAANMETALNALWDGKPSAGDTIVVIGAGVVGLLIAWLCHAIPGTRVTVVDVDPGKAGIAAALGLTFLERTPVHADADLVIHASGRPEGLAPALEAAGLEATVLEVSWHGAHAVSLPLGEAFHSRRLTLKSSQVGRIPPDRAPRWNYARRMGMALDLLRDPRLDALITGQSDFETLPEVMAELSRNPRGALCHRIRYPAS